ncbi:MAG TPA: hypothetical protein EYP85_00705 [Armatimonadetes bacterium]|nr:hypothetical protein [Armatimonadota bacterium]
MKRLNIDEYMKRRIDRWIKRANRNCFGDPKDTMYTGGTPLFNERTGERLDRYRYILDRHPELWYGIDRQRGAK